MKSLVSGICAEKLRNSCSVMIEGNSVLNACFWVQSPPPLQHRPPTHKVTEYILDFKLAPCSKCCILSIGYSPAFEFYMPTFRNTVNFISVGGISRKNTLTPSMKMEHSVPKRRYIKFRRRGILKITIQ